MSKHSEAPGLLRVKRRQGHDYYWVASRASKTAAAKKYTPRTLKLKETTDAARAQKCTDLTAELTEWLKNGGAKAKVQFDGTLRSLNAIYEGDEDSPYQDLKPGSQSDHGDGVKVLLKAVGARRVDSVIGKDLRRWHKKFKKAKKGGAPRLRRAQGAIKALRRIVSWGVQSRLPGCAELQGILSVSRFTMPPGREAAPTYEQVMTYIEKAHAAGRPSLAMAAALQYDCAMRLYDVIGQWTPAKQTKRQGGYYDHGKRWGGGILWSEIKDGTLTKKATKNGAKLKFNVADCPLLSQEIARVPAERRIGPMVVDEATGRPYRIRWFNTLYKRNRRAAGIPDDVWARDTRAAAITEAFDAGADDELVRQTAGHSDPKVTGRYNRGSTRQTSNVLALRTALRGKATK